MVYSSFVKLKIKDYAGMIGFAIQKILRMKVYRKILFTDQKVFVVEETYNIQMTEPLY